MRTAATALSLAWFVAAVPALAQSPATADPQGEELALSGHIAHPRSYSAKDLAVLPQVSVDVPANGSPQAPTTHLTGVLVWPLLDAAGWSDVPGRKTYLQHVILARGKDGYAVALSIAELDPGFEGKQVIVAMAQDGKPLDHPELVVPGDHRAGRRVKDIVALDVQ